MPVSRGIASSSESRSSRRAGKTVPVPKFEANALEKRLLSAVATLHAAPTVARAALAEAQNYADKQFTQLAGDTGRSIVTIGNRAEAERMTVSTPEGVKGALSADNVPVALAPVIASLAHQGAAAVMDLVVVGVITAKTQEKVHFLKSGGKTAHVARRDDADGYVVMDNSDDDNSSDVATYNTSDYVVKIGYKSAMIAVGDWDPQPRPLDITYAMEFTVSFDPDDSENVDKYRITTTSLEISSPGDAASGVRLSNSAATHTNVAASILRQLQVDYVNLLVDNNFPQEYVNALLKKQLATCTAHLSPADQQVLRDAALDFYKQQASLSTSSGDSEREKSSKRQFANELLMTLHQSHVLPFKDLPAELKQELQQISPTDQRTSSIKLGQAITNLLESLGKFIAQYPKELKNALQRWTHMRSDRHAQLAAAEAAVKELRILQAELTPGSTISYHGAESSEPWAITFAEQVQQFGAEIGANGVSKAQWQRFWTICDGLGDASVTPGARDQPSAVTLEKALCDMIKQLEPPAVQPAAAATKQHRPPSPHHHHEQS